MTTKHTTKIGLLTLDSPMTVAGAKRAPATA